jgi:hypothetical protein
MGRYTKQTNTTSHGGRMSRTRKGGKGPGFEYWTARPGNRAGGTPGRITKTHTHRTERRQGKDETRRALDD